MLIGFAGKAGSGKDYAANRLSYLVQGKTLKHYKLADPIKQFCRLVFDWNEDHTDGDLKETASKLGVTPRQAMQWLGTEWGRKIDPDCWVNHCLRKIYRDMHCNQVVTVKNSSQRTFKNLRTQVATITDIRFRNEAEALLSWGGYLIFLEGGGLQGQVANHASESSVESVKPLSDIIIDNSARDTQALDRALQGFLDSVRDGTLKDNRHAPAVYDVEAGARSVPKEPTEESEGRDPMWEFGWKSW